MLLAKFGSILPSSFRGEDFFNGSQSEKSIALGGHVHLHKSSPLKLLSQMEPNLAGSIYVRYSIKLLHMVPFGQQNGHQEQFFFLIFAGKTERNEETL
jgi:hypothetical protein